MYARGIQKVLQLDVLDLIVFLSLYISKMYILYLLFWVCYRNVNARA